MKKSLLKAKALKPGATIGVFTPSTPAHVLYRDKYLHGIEVLKKMGFQVIEGELTRSQKSQGYRTASPQERAEEFMALIRDPKVAGLISTIGGTNSSSLIPYLDFDAIRASQKVICGYSDVTSLHMSILAYSQLKTFYGPAVMPSFGEWPDVLPETKDAFLAATTAPSTSPQSTYRKLTPPKMWSNHFRDARSDAWKSQPREFKPNPGWKCLNPGEATGPIVIANLNTLMSCAGTSYFPNLENKIFLIETMGGTAATEERLLRHLERLGVFDVISGLIVGKIEDYKHSGEPFTHDELILEVVGRNRKYPIVTGFDLSHTNPMLTCAEETRVLLQTKPDYRTDFTVLESMVE